mgnify:CR=1 FL=1
MAVPVHGALPPQKPAPHQPSRGSNGSTGGVDKSTHAAQAALTLHFHSPPSIAVVHITDGVTGLE